MTSDVDPQQRPGSRRACDRQEGEQVPERLIPAEVASLIAAYRFVETLAERADAYDGIAPLWHGWAIREAFEKGVEWEWRNSPNAQMSHRDEQAEPGN